MKDSKILTKAEKILLANRRKGYTIPSAQIYPFQWKWDSGFTVIGYIHFDIRLAMEELQTLFSAQWPNGFVPHIIFHASPAKKNYFPDAGFYQSALFQNNNLLGETSTITQPPIEGWVLERIFQAGRNLSETKAFVKEMFPKIMAQHKYLYKCRDPFDEGLVYIKHNWESGTDNSPVWDEIWESFAAPSYNFNRKDTTQVQEDQRPTKNEYDHYLYLIELFKSLNNDDGEIAKHSPFLVQDPLFNSMLAASNNSLIRLAEYGGSQEDRKQLENWNKKTIKALNEKLFDKDSGVYRHYDLRRNKWLDGLTSSGFTPLFAGAPSPEMLKKMLSALNRFSKEGRFYLCPSFDPDDVHFESQRYWRGPVWVNMNWLIYEGLNAYGLKEWAQKIKMDTLQIVREQGFYEYFEPEKEKSKKQKKGYGGKDFSWTASLVIDLLKDNI